MRQSKAKQKELAKQYMANRVKNGNSMEGNICCWFDGACEPKNPGGNMGVGACIRIAGEQVFTHSRFIAAKDSNSNNVAEYMGLEAILDFIIQNNWQNKTVTIYGDSKLVIEQNWGTWKMNYGFYIPYAKRCKEKLQAIKANGNRVNGIWIRREQNGYADELSKQELINHNVEFKIQPLTLDPSK